MKKITKSFKEKSVKELENEAESIREELSRLILSFKSNPPKDTNLYFKKRKQLAVLLTILGEKRELEKISKNKR